MPASVLLRHDLPDGRWHLDWMIQPREHAPLVTFRITERIDAGPPMTFSARRIQDHRTDYLTYEGPVSGERGAVRRLADGFMAVEINSPTEFSARGRLGNARGLFRARRVIDAGTPAAAPGDAPDAGEPWIGEFIPE
jgi:hypothetical protein